jgi:hypothetical protein
MDRLCLGGQYICIHSIMLILFYSINVLLSWFYHSFVNMVYLSSYARTYPMNLLCPEPLRFCLESTVRDIQF